MTKSITEVTYSFYQVSPFNDVASTTSTASYLQTKNLIATEYPDLDQVLSRPSSRTMFEGGCGIGWLSISAALHYQIVPTAIDFNEKVIELAKEISRVAGVADASFRAFNVLQASKLNQEFDVVVSIGVLHHTEDAKKGVQELSTMVARHEDARLYIGLYHLYGRKPFLDYFAQLKKEGYSESERYEFWVDLFGNNPDEVNMRSRFRDEVLHPHETLHTLQEVVGWLDELGYIVESTSINGFEPFDSFDALYDRERRYEQIAYRRNFLERRYFPGLFTVCARRR
jgi:hypothetical protein